MCPAIHKCVKDELCVVGRLLLSSNRIVVPLKLISKIEALAHEGRLQIVGTCTKQALRTKPI